ncbi:GNAT family N-acetyltransferase [Myceligenerans pegani]|uniref:GNAT family N-acetyltransferase n=1 Tax=Myceligenerans pegani TaxID=2776917 RepID=A0ABR9N1D5_9MICO|nr:GNAT family N-acetyltransferase [Myceligenerans sp. TRM 65318]MBE1877444.1 GNAT family N-acetyltransferase [Myceligenerans sp. TRM 65318]MBE3019715.1 GNAT family N-acetyltransferase [Myceligenerans sp. TRM 65318]
MPRRSAPVIAPGLGSTTQPTLATPDGELLLRPFRPGDADPVFRVYQDPAVRRWHDRTMSSVDEAREWCAATATKWAADDRAEWAVTATSDDELLGRVTVRSWNLHEGLATVGYWVAPEARGRRIATRALETAVAWAFEVGFHRLELDHATGNTASCRVAEKTGFQLEGTLRSAALHEEGWLDMHLHARIAD